MALQLGVEDNVVFWNAGEWEDRMTARFAESGATGASADWEMPSSHLPQLRVGLSYRLR